MIDCVEGNGESAVILVPAKCGAAPTFMTVKNFRLERRKYLWDEVFYTEDVKNAWNQCHLWTKIASGTDSPAN